MWAAPGRSTWAQLSTIIQMKDKVMLPFISVSIVLPLLGLLSPNFWPRLLLCYHIPCSSLYLFGCSEAMGSATKSVLPGLPPGVLDGTFFLQLCHFSAVSLSFIPLQMQYSAVCLPQCVHKNFALPCVFWISLAVSYFSELSFHSFMYFYSVLGFF